MADFTLKVTKGNKRDVIKTLKSTSTLSDMVKQIKRLYRVSGLGAFSLQYCKADVSEVFWDSVFYKDEQEIDPNNEENETLENFFGNAESAEIIFVPKTAGCDDIMIGNATDENLVAKLEYGIINRQPLTKSQKVAVELNANVAKQTGMVKPTGESTTGYAEKTLEQKSRLDEVDLPPHNSGRKLQIALDKGYFEGTRAVTVTIYRKDDIEFKNRLTKFKVERGEMWILYPGPKQGEVLYGKTKFFLFFKRQYEWVDKDGHDRDPHACLKKGDYCGVCYDPALQNGSKIKKHRKMRVGEKCSVCEKYTEPEPSEQPQQPQE